MALLKGAADHGADGVQLVFGDVVATEQLPLDRRDTRLETTEWLAEANLDRIERAEDVLKLPCRRAWHAAHHVAVLHPIK